MTYVIYIITESQLASFTEFLVAWFCSSPKMRVIMWGPSVPPSFIDPPPALTYTWTWPSCMGPIQNAFPPLVGVCSGVHFHFECTFMTLTPFPLAGFFKISLAVCYFSNGFGPWPSHYLQGVYKRTNYRLTCTSFKGKQILKHVFFSSLHHKILYPKIQQTKMLVTYQRFGDLFLFGLVLQYSTNQNVPI